MMLLLQCPWPKISPSRNHTPGAISFTVLACASLRVTTKPSESRATNAVTSNKRTRFILVDSIELEYWGAGVEQEEALSGVLAVVRSNRLWLSPSLWP